MTFLPPTGKTTTTQTGGQAQVEYRLVREAVIRDVRRGRVDRIDVCDAHPELLRAAKNVGRIGEDACPICEETKLVTVSYVFGAGLPPGGRCPGTAKEMNALKRRVEPVLVYEIEVCPGCKWHHLMRKYPSGGRSTQRRSKRNEQSSESR